jgi:hypothetical protein
MPGISNAAIPAAGVFTKIAMNSSGTDSYLLYTDNTGLFKKINLVTSGVDDVFIPTILASDFVVSGTDIYALEKNTNLLKVIISGTVANIASIPNATLKTIIPGYGVVYVQNNNLYSTTLGQLTFTNDIYASSDVVVQGGYLYYARGQKGAANLYRLLVGTSNPIQQITTTANLSGVFTINPASGVIYYGILVAGQNTIGTVASGVYKFADIYQAHLSGTTWIFNAATQVKSPEGFDMLIQSPIYSGNHLYYIGAGHNGVIGNGLELEVWNLYYENACAPALQRVAADDIDSETATDVFLYPNPFNTELSVDLSTYTEDGNLTSVAIEVIDATGKIIYNATVLSELVYVSTQEWAQGMYVVKIKHKNTVINRKVIKY